MPFTQNFTYYHTSWNKVFLQSISQFFSLFLNAKIRFISLLFLQLWCLVYCIFAVTEPYHHLHLQLEKQKHIWISKCLLHRIMHFKLQYNYKRRSLFLLCYTYLKLGQSETRVQSKAIYLSLVISLRQQPWYSWLWVSIFYVPYRCMFVMIDLKTQNITQDKVKVEAVR